MVSQHWRLGRGTIDEALAPGWQFDWYDAFFFAHENQVFPTKRILCPHIPSPHLCPDPSFVAHKFSPCAFVTPKLLQLFQVGHIPNVPIAPARYDRLSGVCFGELQLLVFIFKLARLLEEGPFSGPSAGPILSPRSPAPLSPADFPGEVFSRITTPHAWSTPFLRPRQLECFQRSANIMHLIQTLAIELERIVSFQTSSRSQRSRDQADPGRDHDPPCPFDYIHKVRSRRGLLTRPPQHPRGALPLSITLPQKQAARRTLVTCRSEALPCPAVLLATHLDLTSD